MPNVPDQISEYIQSLPMSRAADIGTLNELINKLFPTTKLWFLDGKNEQGKIVANPQIGYGSQTINYADGKSKEFYQVGISANTTGISVYIMGLVDKKYLPSTYGDKIGKATVTGYCIKFKSLKDIDIAVLEEALKDGVEKTSKSI
ncbi:MAG: hypothetical protein OHK0017_05950 [Patescibacteria group bacterium]